MGQTLKDMVAEDIITAKIVHSGDSLVIPENVTLTQAKSLIERRMKYEEEVVSISESFDVFPWDGAYAFDQVLTSMFGWSPAEATPGFFGDSPPEMITIDVDHDRRVQVPWGQFSLPNIVGHLNTGLDKKEGRFVFALSATVKRLSEPVVRKLFVELRAYLKTNSIYAGKAIRMRFRAENGKALSMPEPKFMDVNDVDEGQLVYSREVTNAVDTNLFTPIKRIRELRANGIPVKRGVLLGGVYGTGKTMAAKVASKFAVQSGVTFLYVTRADELADALNFARQYQNPGCVVFTEDVDRVLDGQRDVKMDDMLNIIDGIDTKSANIMVVLTTNNLSGIHAAMLRPGRLDAVIEVTPPDAEAVQRLLRVYLGATLEPGADLTRVGLILDGKIPAVVAEVVRRAKLAQLRLNAVGVPVSEISAAALEDAAETMELQLQLIEDQQAMKKEPMHLEAALADLIVRTIGEPMKKAIEVALED